MTTINSSQTQKRKRGRPPNVDRGFRDTRRELLRSGVALITENGFMSSGIDTIVKRVNVPKGSFYHYFKSKEDFGKEVIKEYGLYFAKKLDSHLLRQDILPLERIVCFVDDAKAGMIKFHFQRGCLVGNMMQESPQLSESCTQQLQNVLLDWNIRIRNCLLEAKKREHISANINEAFFAEQFWSGWEGAVMRAKLFQSTAPLDNFRDFFINALNPTQIQK